MSKKEAKRERVEDINQCSTPADIAEYLEDNPFNDVRILDQANPYLDKKGPINKIGKVLQHALYKPTNLNFTQYQLKLQSLSSAHDITRAYAVLLRIMEIRFSLERLDL